MKRLFAVALTVLMLISLTACGNKPAETTPADGEQAKTEESTQTGGQLIGVAMPTKSLQRWNQDGDNMKKQLEAKGYKVELQYAENDVNTQVNQIENMITKGVKVLVIASIDGSALADVGKLINWTPKLR